MGDFSKIFAFFENCALTWFERQLVEELYSLIKPKIENYERRCGNWPRYDKSFSNTTTISNYRAKIDRIVRILDSSDQRRKEFLGNFPTWKIQREENIKLLRKIAESLKNVRQVSNVVKITAGGVGVVGGAAIIGSLLFPPAAPALLPTWLGGAAASALLPSVFMGTAPVVSSLAVAGGAAAAGGAVANVGATIAELVLTNEKLDEVKKVIAEDRQKLKELGVFEFLDDLNNAIDALFDTSTSSRILDDVVDFLDRVPSVLADIRSLSFQTALISCLERILPGISQFLLVGISLASVILSIFFVVFMVRRRGCTILNHRLALGLVSAVDASVEITRLIAAAGLKGSKLGELIPRQLAGKIAVGAVAGVGIALDVASIVVSAIDLADESQSEEILMIIKVAGQLESQLSSYQDVNEKLSVTRRLRRDAVTNWTAVVVNHVPRHANQNDIIAAIKQYLSDDAWDCIILERLQTNGNHWLVKVPTSPDQRLLSRTFVNIKEERCLVMQ